MRLSPRQLPSWDPSLPQQPAPLRPCLAHHEIGAGGAGKGSAAPTGWRCRPFYCLCPGGQRMPKVVKEPELGPTGTGWSTMPASPSNPPTSPEELGFIRREKRSLRGQAELGAAAAGTSDSKKDSRSLRE